MALKGQWRFTQAYLDSILTASIMLCMTAVNYLIHIISFIFYFPLRV
jgi:hypothetical protein